MPFRSITARKVAAKLRKHHEEIASHYREGSVEMFEEDWMEANEKLEQAIVIAIEFDDEDVLTEALKAHQLSLYRLIERGEKFRMKQRLEEIAREFRL